MAQPGLGSPVQRPEGGEEGRPVVEGVNARLRLAELGLSEAAVAAMKDRFVALDTGYLEDRAWLTEAPVAAGL